MPNNPPNEFKIVNALAITDANVHNSEPFRFGVEGYGIAVFSVENDLDQDLTAQAQGRAWDGTTWQNIGSSVTVTASDVNTITVTEPWGLLRLQLTATLAPASGTVSAWMDRAKSGTAPTAASGGATTVAQPTHNNLNANANIQVGDADVALGNPVPVSDAGGTLTVDQVTHDNLNANANIQVGDADVAVGNPVPVSDAGGSFTVDGTVGVSGITAVGAVAGQAAMAASIPVVEASDTPFAVAIGATGDAAVTTDAVGTLSGKIRGLVKWVAERMPAALGQGTMVQSFPVVVASNQSAVPVTPGAQEVHLGEVGGNSGVVTVTPTVTAGAYTALDIVGAIQTIANATRVSGEATILQSITVTDLAKQNVELTIFFFNANPANGTYTDNLALTIHDTDMAMCVGKVKVSASDYSSAAASSVATVSNLALLLTPAATSLIAIAQASSGAPTYASTSDLRFLYGFFRD